MKTTKMSLANIKGKLSRTEMKNIMAGSGGNSECITHCTYYQAGCSASKDYKACSTGSGIYDWKCC